LVFWGLLQGTHNLVQLEHSLTSLLPIPQEHAIEYSWELLTKVYGIPPDRLYVTYFEGDPKNGVPPDEEARQLWVKQGVAQDHILPGNAKDNFWEMGATGPCGPCSEIHYDRIGGRNAAHLVNQDDPDVLEIWNNVFIQFNREEDGTLKPLPAKHVDTGLGFERLVSVLQDARSNYDTDVFSPIFEKIHELTGILPYQGKFGPEDIDGIDTAYRVVADHVRTLTIALSDGGVPDSVGRGYVLRRILRRGARYARKKLGINIGSFFSSLVPVVVQQMGDTFPEITRKIAEISEILNEEEASFAVTLDRGEKLFDKMSSRAVAEGAKELSGKDVWRLYDTFGFPVDLTRLMAEELGLVVNEKEFEEAQAQSKEASKASLKSGSSSTIKLDVHDLALLEKDDNIPKTDDSAKYLFGDIDSQVKAIFWNKAFLPCTDNIPANEVFGILLDRTSFYAESGGQEYDTGNIIVDSFGEDGDADAGEANFQVENVQMWNGYVLHIGYLKYGQLRTGSKVVSSHDKLRRWPIRNNHTATHILNYSLREILGDHIDQKGSLVAPTKLRFDFSHKAQVTPAELTEIETLSKRWIQKDVPVYSKEVDLKTARAIPGLRAVFGETYPDPVRVVSLEYDVDTIVSDVTNPKWRTTSIEFCGGTHVAKTGEIQDLVITEESGIAKGIRRIVALTGHEAAEVTRIADALSHKLDLLDKSSSGKAKDAALKSFTKELDQADISVLRKGVLRERLATIRKLFDKQVKDLEIAANKQALENVVQHFADMTQDSYVATIDVNGNSKILQGVVAYCKKLDKAVYVLSNDEAAGKVAHVNFVPSSLRAKGLDARKWAAVVVDIVGGKAGGKEDSAQGSGNSTGRIADATTAASKYLSHYN
jgi:alanyl-tRNA synthetase